MADSLVDDALLGVLDLDWGHGDPNPSPLLDDASPFCDHNHEDLIRGHLHGVQRSHAVVGDTRSDHDGR